jgi:HEAT repeat-containing protein 5
VKSRQSTLEAALVKVITGPEPYPPPGRALRNPAVRSLIALYTRTETRTLFDALQTFMAIVGDFKSSGRDANKT